MRRSKAIVMTFLTALAVAVLLGLAGCVADVDYGYGYGGDTEWDGTVFVGGGYVGGGYDRDHRGGAFDVGGGRRPVQQGRDRGRQSLGSRAGGGGGGHAPAGGGGGGHAPSGGGGRK